MRFAIGATVITMASVIAYWAGASLGEALIFQVLLMIYWEVIRR